MDQPTETTLALIKPGAVRRSQAVPILEAILDETPLAIRRMARLTLDRRGAEAFYGQHRAADYFERIVTDLSSGPIVAAFLIGPSAIQTWRTLLGPSDPAKAPPNTIRGRFSGPTLPDNGAHGSDSFDACHREHDLIFARRTSPTPVRDLEFVLALSKAARLVYPQVGATLKDLRRDILHRLVSDAA